MTQRKWTDNEAQTIDNDKPWIYKIIIWGVVGLTLVNFILSYSSLFQLALNVGYNWWLAWALPFGFDAIMIVAAMATLRATIKRDNPTYAGAMVIGFTLLSIAGNVLHLPTDESWYVNGVAPWLPYVVFAIPPIACALSFHLLVVNLNNDIKRGMLQPIKEVSKQNVTISKPSQKVSPVSQPPDTKLTSRQHKIMTLKGQGENVSAIAAKIKRSEKTVYRELAEIEKVMSQNGHG